VSGASVGGTSVGGPSLSRARDASTIVPLRKGRYKVQFTASQSLVDMFNEARDLFQNQLPTGDLASIVQRALALLIAERKKQRFAQTTTPRLPRLSESETAAPRSTASANKTGSTTSMVSAEQQPSNPNSRHIAHASEAVVDKASRPAPSMVSAEQQPSKLNGRHIEHASFEAPADDARAATPAVCVESQPARSNTRGRSSKPNTRYIAYALRRQVYARDGGRCRFVSPDGTRCRARGNLEFHHIVPFAFGGTPTLDNICLMCRAHNALLAERDYGREFVKRRIADRGSAPPRARAQDEANRTTALTTTRSEKTMTFSSGTPVRTHTISLSPDSVDPRKSSSGDLND
jgi:5-methylcytosine-specific restriction endonuclease McrA